MSSNKFVGLYDRYKVERLDGSSEPGGKHEYCDYYVLDIHHDKYAAAALRAYALSCMEDYPLLAHDLWLRALENEHRFKKNNKA